MKQFQQAPSQISSIFEDGKLKVMRGKELELKKKGISYDGLEDVVDETQRKKLIAIDYNTWSAYFWIPLERRGKAKDCRTRKAG